MKNKLAIFIIILFIIAILYSLWPLYSRYSPAQNKLNTSSDMYKSMIDNFQTEDSIKAKKMDYINKINELNFRTQLNQEEIISVLYTCAQKNNIYISDIKFIEEEDVLDNGDIEIIESEGTAVFETMGVVIEFKAEFEKLLKFVDTIKSFRDISVINLNATVWEGDIVLACAQMKFYAVPVDMDL